MQDGLHSTKGYVIFCEGRRFWWLPLKKGFSHVYYVKDCGHSWVKVQPYLGFSDVTIWSKSICPHKYVVIYVGLIVLRWLRAF